MDRSEFLRSTKQLALNRQKNKCGSCGEKIMTLNQTGRLTHKYGEGARAHHMMHCQHGGTNNLSNCIILCESCHYSAHSGGNYRNNAQFLISKSSDYKYFYG